MICSQPLGLHMIWQPWKWPSILPLVGASCEDETKESGCERVIGTEKGIPQLHHFSKAMRLSCEHQRENNRSSSSVIVAEHSTQWCTNLEVKIKLIILLKYLLNKYNNLHFSKMSCYIWYIVFDQISVLFFRTAPCGKHYWCSPRNSCLDLRCFRMDRRFFIWPRVLPPCYQVL